MMRIGMVGGTWDNAGGRSSGTIDKIYNELSTYGDIEITYRNGGEYYELGIMEFSDMDIILWFPDIPNDIDKGDSIKNIYPKSIVITSKRNFDNEYTSQEIIAHALNMRSNMVLEFSNMRDTFFFRLMDPLSNIWYHGNYIKGLCKNLIKRLTELMDTTRVPSYGLPDFLDKPSVPNRDKFFGLIREWGERFHELIHPVKTVTRFLGNGSFRCTKGGFPSMRDNGIVYVTRRNIDKRNIDGSHFVPIALDSLERLWYWGDNKPSVDSPIQARLYKKLPNINYMLHAHVFIRDAPYTKRAIPCGGLQEVDEVMEFVNENTTFARLNLRGHGCLIMASEIAYFSNIKSTDFYNDSFSIMQRSTLCSTM